jgi:putative FmdB family regulatory protein
VALYDYRCDTCGSFEVFRPLGAAREQENCPECGSLSGRRFGTGGLTAPASPARQAWEAAARTASEPGVSGPPPARPRPRSTNPLHARLPRP